MLHIMLILQRIETSKELFMLEIERGKEAYISLDLSLDHFPYSFRYYDQIISMIKTNTKMNVK